VTPGVGELAGLSDAELQQRGMVRVGGVIHAVHQLSGGGFQLTPIHDPAKAEEGSVEMMGGATEAVVKGF
jgi:hypothetical protein